MGRIQTCFEQLSSKNKKAVIPFVTAGYPSRETTVELMHAMVRAGSDIIELGVPFSDPSADGPVIQAASDKALENGIGLKHVLDMVQEFRQTNATTPVVLMGYANPIERYNQLHKDTQREFAFVEDARNAGVDGVLIVDYPPEECEEFAQTLHQAGIDLIFLLAPTSTTKRMEQIGRLASGYVYYVSLKGVTGSGALDIESVAQAIPKIREYVKTPVGVGFGIRDVDSAKAVAAVSDGVVIGSKIIQLLSQGGVASVEGFLREIRKAVDS